MRVWAGLGVLWLAAAPVLADLPSQPTLAAGIEAIRDRALTALPTEVIALEGLKGLAAIDPAVTVVRDPQRRIALDYRNRRIASYAPPPDDDAAGWATLILQASREVARRSPGLGKADSDHLTEAVMDGFLSKLDIFSHYAGPIEARERRAARNGFGGIGVRYEFTGGVMTLSEIIPDSPAAQAKLHVGDHVIAIDGTGLTGLDQTALSLKLRGPIASPVTLTLDRQGAPATVIVLHRALVVPTSVTASSERGIAVITISSFNQTTGSALADAVKKAHATPGLKGVILDLRGNSGGLLDQAVLVADQFIGQGRILTTKGRHPGAAQSQDARPGDAGEQDPLVVLIDGRTASAAEILTADLQDSGRAVVVGSNSFGKGVIQTVLDLPNHGELTLTWSRFYAPSGYALHGLGILPAICTAATRMAEDRPLAGGRAPPPDMFAAWRAAPIDDRGQRLRLRRHCPAIDQSEDQADLAIARRLIEDRDLYARALAVAAPVATASSQRGLPPLDHH